MQELKSRCSLALNLLAFALWFLLSVVSARATPLNCERVVSLAPSISEILFELDLGETLVGVSRFDAYPAAVKRLPKVGGLLDPNLEFIYGLKPNIVFGLTEQSESLSKLNALGVELRFFNHKSLSGIYQSIFELGEVCSRSEKAQTLLRRLKREVLQVQSQLSQTKAKRVLLAISGDGRMDFRSLFISGRDGFYSELLELLGATNVFSSYTSAFGSLSSEALFALNPDTIIIISSQPEIPAPNRQELLSIWSVFDKISAVRDKRIFVIEQDYASVPGPRFVKLLQDLARILN